MAPCPKCGRDNDVNAVICTACDYILDTSFLGDDILDDRETPPPVDYGSDSLILGHAGTDDEFDSFTSETTGDFLTAATSAGVRAIRPAEVYIDRQTKALLEDAAILRVKESVDVGSLQLSPFESHILTQFDGQRPVARARKLTGLSEDDFRIGAALVIDKGVLELVGHAERVGDDDDDDGDNPALAEATIDSTGFASQGPITEGVPPLDESASPFDDQLAPAPMDLPLDALQPVEPAASPAAAVPPLPSSNIPPLPGGNAGIPPLPGTPAGIPALPSTDVTTPASASSGSSSASGPAPKPMPRPSGLVVREAGPAVSGADAAEALRLYNTALKDVLDGKDSRAKQFIHMAKQKDPTNVDVQNVLNHWQEARGIAMRHLQVREDVQLVAEAKRAEQRGDFEESVRLLKKAVTFNPKASQIFNHMGVVLATRLKRYQEGLDSLFKAVELDSTNPVYKNNLGKIMSMAEKAGEAPTEKKSGGFAALFKKKLF